MPLVFSLLMRQHVSPSVRHQSVISPSSVRHQSVISSSSVRHQFVIRHPSVSPSSVRQSVSPSTRKTDTDENRKAV